MHFTKQLRALAVLIALNLGLPVFCWSCPAEQIAHASCCDDSATADFHLCECTDCALSESQAVLASFALGDNYETDQAPSLNRFFEYEFLPPVAKDQGYSTVWTAPVVFSWAAISERGPPHSIV